MKKFFSFILAAGVIFLAASCESSKKQQPVKVSVQLQYEQAAFEVEGVSVTLTDASGASYYEAVTMASGAAEFTVPVGSYTASAVYKETKDGERIAYNGSNNNIIVTAEVSAPFVVNLLKVVSQQIIIKELYNGGCLAADGAGSYASDQYVILYNNSADEADASNIVFAITAPYQSNSANAYYGAGNVLLYEKENWIPAAAALWWFTEPVKIAPWSQIVVVFKNAIDHSANNPNSIDLSKADYYWMNNKSIPLFSRGTAYSVSENIPASHYLAGSAWAGSPSGWPVDQAAPAFFIGKMPKDEADKLCKASDQYDTTLGVAMFYQVKFPKANVVDAVEVWAKGNEENSHVRFPADINSGAVVTSSQLGHSVYRNVDKEATEALAENAGKIVYKYAGGTEDAEGTTDPSGIDAEASIANGAHIVYSETNDSSKDFHQRKVASLKK